MTDTLGFSGHLRREWRFAPRRGPIVMMLVGVGCVAFNHLVLPLFPERAIAFMRAGFRLEDMAGVLALNDLMGVYFPTFFVGLASSLGVVLLAREEHRLELLLAKPVRTADFVAARALPVLAWTAAVGVGISAAMAVALALQGEVGRSVSPVGALGGGLFLTALAVVLLAALQIAFVRIRDPFTGLLVACGVWLGTSVPTAVLLYRPDAFAGHPVALHNLVMPSLLWHEATLGWLGPLCLLASLPLAVALARTAGAWLERSDAL
ncbi:hypothetical protein [Nannocystis punicea]|uniref:ABC-2 type transport system permease protein n=1 Tax=Nannocystis punicea TaxID=2995304 RepID=A0ABY7HAT3_9BACT|nr:hypothetical protein [Nannocystis poenicansa]WAS96353.1 hypothetical protein O0S08_09350 [Nannocystis poenicansa]